MNQKMVVNIEIENGDYTFVFSMPTGASYGAAYDAAHDVLNAILEMSQQAADQKKRTEEVQTEEVQTKTPEVAS